MFGSLAARLRICWTAVALYGCATAGRAKPPAFTTGIWRVRIDVDSAPTRRVQKQTLFGTIVGTWTETVICCSAGGRFSLWRATSPAIPR